MSRPTKNELTELQGFENHFEFTPNLVIDVFKNRRGRWTMVRIWAYHDLGTCRRQDLFITTADMKPIKDFQVIQFNNMNYGNYQDLCDFYNEGIVSNEIYEELTNLSDEKPEDLLKDAAAAFEDVEDNRRRLKNKSFEELMEF